MIEEVEDRLKNPNKDDEEDRLVRVSHENMVDSEGT